MPFPFADGTGSPVVDEIVGGPAAALTAVALVVAPGARASGWGAQAALALATGWRGPRRVLLADLDLERPTLHEPAGIVNDEGVVDLIEYGISLGRLSRSAGSGAFDFLPAGLFTTDPGAILRHEGWSRVLLEVAARRGTLLACVPSEADGVDAVVERAGAVLVLAESGEGREVVERLPHPYAVLAILTPPAAALTGAQPVEQAGAGTERVAIAAAADELLADSPDEAVARPDDEAGAAEPDEAVASAAGEAVPPIPDKPLAAIPDGAVPRIPDATAPQVPEEPVSQVPHEETVPAVPTEPAPPIPEEPLPGITDETLAAAVPAPDVPIELATDRHIEADAGAVEAAAIAGLAAEDDAGAEDRTAATPAETAELPTATAAETAAVEEAAPPHERDTRGDAAPPGERPGTGETAASGEPPLDAAAREALSRELRERQRSARLAGATNAAPLTAAAAAAAGVADGRQADPAAAGTASEGGGTGAAVPPRDPQSRAPQAGPPLAVRRRGVPRFRRPILWTLGVVLLASLLAGAWHYLSGRLEREPTTAVVPPPPEPEPPAAPAEQNALPFVVAIEAHRELLVALNRVTDLTEIEPELLFHVEPLEREGTIFYHVMAGPVPDSAAALALRDTLIARGHKTGPTPTDVRATPLAFLIGDYGTPEGAEEQREVLRRLDIPGYVLRGEAVDGAPLYRLYVGGFGSVAEADIMRQLLQSAGIRDSLVTRTGIVPEPIDVDTDGDSVTTGESPRNTNGQQ